MDHHEALQLLADEQARLASDLLLLPSEVWSGPSQCDGWSVARVVVHLTQGAEQYTESVSEALTGDNPQARPNGRTLSGRAASLIPRTPRRSASP